MAMNRRSLWIVIGVIVLGVILWGFSMYNTLITERENVDTSWRQVETQYQRRFDLIPNLVSTVRGEADFEQDTLTQVTNARTQWLNANQSGDRDAQVAATEQTESALARLLVTVESYPQLRATQAFENLMVQLEGTENRIATARRDYNEAVRIYNLKVKRFPGNIFAGLFGFDAEPGFQSDDGSEDAPDVNFDQ
jgi:LemA protein